MRAAVDAAVREIATAFGTTPGAVAIAVSNDDRPGFVSACVRGRAADRASVAAGRGHPVDWKSDGDVLSAEDEHGEIRVSFAHGSCEHITETPVPHFARP
jgi:hypothetical protein